MRRPQTRFVGRRAELERLEGLLAAGERLITVLGPPGVGKSRLVQQLGTPGGGAERATLHCELRGVDTAVGWAMALADALDVRVQSGDADALLRQVEAALAARGAVLVVLDDLRALPDGAPDLLSDWLDAAPECQLLATSRERLGRADEAVLELGPLDLEDAADLFVERAKATLGASELPEHRVRVLVESLDRLPLALELAAGRLRVLSVEQLIERSAEQLRLLEGRGQRSLRDAIDSSWALLSEAERAGLAACALFEGEFDLDDAEAVLRVVEGAADAVDLLGRLRDHSLLQVRPGERPRFRTLRSVRQFALERAPPSAALLQAHSRWCLAAAQTAAASLGGPDEERAARRLESLRGDIAACWGRLLSDEPAAAATLALALRGVLQTRGPLPELIPLLEGPLARLARPSELRPRLLSALAEARTLLGAPGAALPAAEQARAEAALLGDPDRVAEALCARAHALVRLGRREEAAGHLEAALAAATPGSQRAARAWSEAGLLHLESGQLDTAEQALQRAEAGFRKRGAGRDLLRVRFRQAGVAAARGQAGRAGALLEEVRASSRQLHDRGWEALATWYLALSAIQQLQDAQAQGLAEGATALWAVQGRANDAARGHGLLGVLALLGGRLDEAAERFARAGSAREGAGRPLHTVQLHESVAILESLRGRREQALIQLDRADVIAAGAAEAAELPAGPLLTRCAVELSAGRRAEAIDAARRAAELAPRGLDLQLTRALLEAALAQDEALPAPLPTQAPQPLRLRLVAELLRWTNAGRPGWEPPAVATPRALQVGPQARWFCRPGEARVDLSRRRAMRQILVQLVRHRLDSPGRGLELDALQEAGWPGQRLHPEAGRARVYTAVRSLRRLGLDGLLITRDDGYLLDPAAALSQAS